MALLTWAIVYPMITILLVALDPWLHNVVVPLRTLILTAILVPAMVYFAMPFATTRLQHWLTGSSQPR